MLRWLRGTGGQDNNHKILSQIFIFSFFIENIITGLSRGESTDYYLMYCLPFFIIPLIIQTIKTQKAISIIYLPIAIAMVITGTLGNFSGIVFLIFSVYLFKSLKYEIITLSIATLAISTNAYIHNLLPSQLFIMLRVYAFIYLIYFFTIRADRKKAEESNIDYNLQGKVFLLPEEKELLKLMANGKNYKEIAQHFGKSQNTITNWKGSLLGKFQASSNEQLMFYFGKYSNIVGDSTNTDK